MRGTKWAWAHLRPRPPRSPGGPRCAAPSGPEPISDPDRPVRTVTGRQPTGRGAEIAAVVAAMQKLAGDKLVAPIPSDW